MSHAARAICLAALCAVAPPVHADEASEFWRGKTVTIVVGGSAGAGFDAYARLLSRHLGRHLPGNPSIVVTVMPGAASNTMGAWIANIAPHDGTFIGAPISSQPLAPVLDDVSQLHYDPTKLNYLGSASEDVFLCVARRDGPAKSFADALTHEVVMGGSGETSQTGYMPMLLNNLLGTKFRLVYGYPGSREMMTAMERREIDGMCSLGWTSLKAQHGDWLRDDRLAILVQERVKGDPEIDRMGVPRAGDFARDDETRKILDIVYSQELFGRPYFVAADTPAERVAALRSAVVDAWRDPDLLADAVRVGLDIKPMSGARMQAMLADIYAAPEELKRRARVAIRPPK
jgi:tripartite-type tricarboxylate transporter receptor subunit TctC